MSGWSRAITAGAPADAVDWDVVYAEQLPRVYNFFRYRLADQSLAEDLTATTFEKAWAARERYRRDIGAFSTWLFTIAQHVAVDYYRQRHAELPLDAALELASDSSPHDEYQRHDDAAHLSQLLAQLGERDRELIALKYGAALTNREIARLTGLSESNVGTLLHRITSKLRGAWGNV